MKIIFILFTIVFLSGCTQRDKESKTIEVGEYLFDFPPDFELIEENGIDSYVGKIKGDSMCFGFDFGYYSNTLEQTPDEYISKGHWRRNLEYQFMEEGIPHNQMNISGVDVLAVRQATVKDSIMGKGSDYIASCRYGNKEFDFAIYIPQEIKQTNFSIDTVDNCYRKIVWAKDPAKGITGIYIRNLNGFNKSMNNYLALSMATGNLTKEQQDIALKIFKTVRPKRLK